MKWEKLNGSRSNERLRLWFNGHIVFEAVILKKIRYWKVNLNGKTLASFRRKRDVKEYTEDFLLSLSSGWENFHEHIIKLRNKQ